MRFGNINNTNASSGGDAAAAVAALFGRHDELEQLQRCYERIQPHQTIIRDSRDTTSNQQQQQQQQQQRETETTPIVTIVRGASGTGKTALAEEFGRRIEEETSNNNNSNVSNPQQIAFVSGKVDEHQSHATYKIVIQVLEDIGRRLCEQRRRRESTIMGGSGSCELVLDDNHRTGGGLLNIQRLLRNEGKILTHLSPSLKELARNDGESRVDENKEGQCDEDYDDDSSGGSGPLNNSISVLSRNSNRIHDDAMSERLICLAVLSFMREVVRAHPLVLFIDDVQWCDRPSLRLLTVLGCDDQLANLNIVIGTRDVSEGEFIGDEEEDKHSPEVARRHAFYVFARSIPDNRKVEIAVGELPLEVFTEWVTTLLPSSQRIDPLSNWVYNITKGNAYFTLRYLELLHRKQLLRYSPNTLRWGWDMDEMMGPPSGCLKGNQGDTVFRLSDTVAMVLNLHLGSLPILVRQYLQVASCLGFVFKEEILKSLLQTRDLFLLLGSGPSYPGGFPEDDGSSPDADSLDTCSWALDLAEKEGLILKTNQACYKFSHDHVRERVYESISKGKQLSLLHFLIGKYLKELGDHRCSILDAADHLNRGSSMLVHEQERLETIELNLEASSHAKMQAGIHSLAHYLQQAILLVRDHDWERSYDLALEVYTRSAEAEYARGNFDSSQDLVETILVHSRGLDDTIRARFVKMQTFSSRRCFSKAIREARSLLMQLGEHVPPPSVISVMLEYYKTRRLVKSMSDDNLINLPPVSDSRELWVIRIVQTATVYGWNCDPAFCALMYLRVMRATLLYGSSENTAFAYAAYGMMIADMGDEIGGARFAELALKQIKDHTSAYAPAYVVVYAFLNHLYRPLASGLENLLSAYRVGLAAGDLTWGPISIGTYAMLYIFCGLPLAPFDMDLRNYCGQLVLCGQNNPLAFMLVIMGLVTNLRGENEDPLNLTWESCKNSFKRSHKMHFEDFECSPSSNIYLQCMQMFNAYILCDMNLAKEAAERANFGRLPGRTHFCNLMHTFLEGLVYASLYRQYKTRRYLKVLDRTIKELKRLAKKKVANCIGMLTLLQAERASLFVSASKDDVRALFDKAISQFARSGFTHFAAIANERAGEFMIHRCDEFWGEHYINEATLLFDEWGSVTKVATMLEKYPFISLHRGTLARSISLKIAINGQARFDELRDAFDQGSSTMLTPNNNDSASS